LWARDNFRTDEQWQQHMNQVEKHEAVFWDSMGEEDLINPRIDIIIGNIEEICQAVIEGKGSIYGFLNQKLGKCS